MELTNRIHRIHNEINDLNLSAQRKDQFIHAIRKFMEMNTQTAPLLRELIDHIDVYETEGTGKNRTQRILIHYRFGKRFASVDSATIFYIRKRG